MLADKVGRLFLVKMTVVLAVLFIVVAAGSYVLTFIDPSQRDGVATMVGAAATIFAGWLAWQSVTLQVRRSEIAKTRQASVRKLDAVVAVTQSIHAASALIAVLDVEISRAGDRDGKSLRVKRSAKYLEQVIDREVLLGLLNELSADDRVNLLMILATMRTAIAMAAIQSEDVLSVDDFGAMRTALARLQTYLAGFDASLHEAFLRDSGLRQTP